VNRRRQPRQRGVRAPCAIPPPGALRRAELVLIVFQEKKALCDVGAPSGPLISAAVVAEGTAALTPHGAGSIRVAVSENALVAALNQAKSTSAADTPVSFRGLHLRTRFNMRHRPTTPQDTKATHASPH
jgi:hypothetical protein